jgi:ferredoxin-NADP reductase/MOSC domain-containing protein YiiM/ferredoxin
MASLISVNVGLPRDVPWEGRTVHTGIWKWPVTGPRMVRRLNVDGDGQGDLGGHGGENRAVMVYQRGSYDHWREFLGRDDLGYGSFGENFTVDGLADDEVCVGDRFRIGGAEFEVTQPRVTCYRVGMRLGRPDMAQLLVGHHRPGFYLRVLREGPVEAGDEIVRTATGPHALTVAEIDALLYLPDRDRDRLREALDVPALSPGWQASFRELVDAADAPPGPAWPGFRPLRVVDLVPESATVTSIVLAAPDGAPLPAARAGQYLSLRVPGAGDPAPVRSYSLSSAPGAARYRVSVKRESHGLVSGYLDRALRPGALLDVAAPRGDFVLEPGTAPVLLISAGIGVTPVLAMLSQLAAEHSDRTVWWIHGARGPTEHPLAAEAHRLLTGLPDGREHVFYSAAPAVPPVTAGRVSAAALAGLGLPAGAVAYVCGPAAFMTDIRDALHRVGIDDVHTELFGALGAMTPGIVGSRARAPHLPDGPPGSGPAVTFARSGITAPDPGTGSLLDLAEACDVPVRWSCRTGVCHTCTTPLLSGRVAYDPEPLEPAAAGEVLLCCTRPTEPVVLDL